MSTKTFIAAATVVSACAIVATLFIVASLFNDINALYENVMEELDDVKVYLFMHFFSKLFEPITSITFNRLQC